MIRLLIADRHALLRDGLQHIVGEVPTAARPASVDAGHFALRRPQVLDRVLDTGRQVRYARCWVTSASRRPISLPPSCRTFRCRPID